METTMARTCARQTAVSSWLKLLITRQRANTRRIVTPVDKIVKTTATALIAEAFALSARGRSVCWALGSMVEGNVPHVVLGQG
jgi:hypothetical protein